MSDYDPKYRWRGSADTPFQGANSFSRQHFKSAQNWCFDQVVNIIHGIQLIIVALFSGMWRCLSLTGMICLAPSRKGLTTGNFKALYVCMYSFPSFDNVIEFQSCKTLSLFSHPAQHPLTASTPVPKYTSLSPLTLIGHTTEAQRLQQSRYEACHSRRQRNRSRSFSRAFTSRPVRCVSRIFFVK